MHIGQYRTGPNETEINGIYTGDARYMGMTVPPNSIDAIFTDPPYLKEYIGLFGWVTEFAARVLKPSGFLCVMSGKYHLDKVFAQMSGKGLDYFWSIDLYIKGDSTVIWPRQMVTKSKPVLMWSKGPSKLAVWNMCDVFQGQGKDKRYHTWGQDVGIGRYLLEYIFGAGTGGVVCDPFAGGGATFEACRILGLDYIGFEADAESADRARSRVREFVPPLFYLAPENKQLELMSA